jgi:membrane protein
VSPSALRARVRSSTAWRAWWRYLDARGNVLAGGVAYFALFSLFPMLVLGFTTLGLVMGGRTDLQREVAESLNGTLGAVVIAVRPGQEGLWAVDEVVRYDLLTGFGLISLGALLISGLGWVGALRDGVRAMFGRHDGSRAVVAKASDLLILILIGLSVLISAAGSVVVAAATGPLLDAAGIGRGRIAEATVSVLSSLLFLAVDTVLLLLMFRVLSGLHQDLDDVFTAALVGAVSLGLLKLTGGVLLRHLSANRALAAFGVLVGLLLWMNLAARLTLLAAAWAATAACDSGHLSSAACDAPVARGSAHPDGALGHEGSGHGGSGPGPAGSVRLPVGHPAGRVPTYSARSADRVTLLAGAVLGATAAAGAASIGRAGRTLRPRRRRPS